MEVTETLKKRGLFIIFGEAFRTGGKFTRARDTPESITLQGLASQTHMILCQMIENKYNIDIDLAFTTYTTPNYDLLKSYYKQLKYEFIHKELIGQTNLVKNVLTNVNINQYEFLFCFRFDMFLKHYFINNFNPFNNKITVSSVCFILCWKEHYIYPRVSDTMLLIPKEYFEIISEDFIFEHEIIGKYISKNMLRPSDFDFILDTLHDSCTEWDYNPLYILVGRVIQQKWHSYGWIFDKVSWEPIKWTTPIRYPDYEL